MKVQLKVLDPAIKQLGFTLEYKSGGAAAVDVMANVQSDVVLMPGASYLVPTGFAIYLNDPAYAAYLLPRSGLGANNGIVLGNLVGLIDSDYQGEVKVALWNRGDTRYTITRGARIAQLVIAPVIQAEFEEVEEFTSTTARGTGGFGSTGV